MITPEALLAAGYLRSRSGPHSAHPYASALYQKRFEDEGGTRYFINFWQYTERGGSATWMCELTQNDPHMTFQIHRPSCITKAEQACLLFWVTLAGSAYYEVN